MGTREPELSAAFRDLRVVEIAGDPAGEMVGKILAGFGADVIKVEPPAGSPTRSTGPFVHGHEDRDHCLAYWYYNTGKRSVVIDLAAEGGLERFGSVLADADICLSTLRPPVARELGLSAAELSSRHPQLIVVSITPFGLDGPWADWRSSDLVGLALGSPLNSCGYDDHSIPPIRPGGDQGHHSAAVHAQIGLLLALIERRRTGSGQVVDIAMHDCLAVGAELANPYWFYSGALVHRQTCRHATPFPTPPSLYRCLDGHVFCAIFFVEQKSWRAIVDWMASKGLADDLEDPVYDAPGQRQLELEHINAVIEAFFRQQRAHDAYLEGQERGLAVGVLNAPEDLFDDEHLHARAFFQPVDHPDLPPVLYPTLPFRFSAFAATPVGRAPNLGEHDAQVLDEPLPRGERGEAAAGVATGSRTHR